MSTSGPIINGYFNYSEGNFIQRIDYDVNSNAIYVGWAQPGTATSEQKWRIAQNTYDGSNRFTQKAFPSGSPAFNFVWDNRASYSYS